MICEECGRRFTPSGRGKKAKYCSAKCKQRAYRRAKRENRVTAPPSDGRPAVPKVEETDPMEPALTADDFELMMNDGPKDYLAVLKRTQRRLKTAMFAPGTPPGSLSGISKQLLALTREIEQIEGTRNTPTATAPDDGTEDTDDDGFRPEAI